ncbi:MAG: hypothetical protein WC884_02170 [Candidatus Paceibacterota bacterium]
MSFDNVSAGQIVAGFWILVALLGLWRLRTILVARREARLADQLAREAYNTEADRVDALPKLSTRFLMRVPNKLMDKNPVKRSYGTRYNRMLIIDENCCGWVGLAIPEILEGLTAGEYVWHSYHIPFRGAGEAYTGKSVDVAIPEGLVHVDIYPMWMTEGVNLPDWTLWARIEKCFHGLSQNWNYQCGLGELNKHMDEFRQKRAELNRLATVANMN